MRYNSIPTAILILSTIILFYKAVFITISYPKTINIDPFTEPQFKKLIYIVLDGLRFDAFIPTNKVGHYYNKFTFTTNMHIRKHAFMSIAGIPTATKCRVLSLMTGTPSNQLEELYAFFSEQVKIDHFLFKVADRSVSFYGDDCWIDLFQQLRKKHKTIHSFSKGNLEDNEDILFKELLNEIKADSADILIGHFISLDSFGHAFGTDDQRIADVLVRFDGYLNRIYENMDEDTLLIVVSDHGVTDEGAHGGNSSQELASVGAFFSKREIASFQAGNDYSNFISQFYKTDISNTENDWIQAKEEYKIIHQDDILITMCYFLGVPLPNNIYANLIPYLINDESAQKKLASLKERQIKENVKIHNENIYAYNYALSNAIYTQSTGKNITYAILCLLISICILYYLYSDFISIIHVVATTIMVTHSYWSFASEDYFWFSTLLFENFSAANLIAFVFYIKTPGRTFFKKDRFAPNIFLHLDKFTDPFSFIALMILFSLCKFIQIKNKPKVAFNDCKLRNCEKFTFLKNNQKFIENAYLIWPQLFYAFSELLSAPASYETKCVFLLTFPSLDSLISLHFKPYNSILLLFFIRNLDLKFTESTKYTLLSLLPYLCDTEKVVQTINFNAFFTFSDNFEFLGLSVSFIAYFILLRYKILIQFSKENKRRQFDRKFLFLTLFGLYFCFVCSWVMHGSLVYQYFFVSRLFFVTGYAIVDFLLMFLLAVCN